MMTDLPDRTELRGFFAAAQREPSLVEYAYLSGNLKSRDEMDEEAVAELLGHDWLVNQELAELYCDAAWGVTDE